MAPIAARGDRCVRRAAFKAHRLPRAAIGATGAKSNRGHPPRTPLPITRLVVGLGSAVSTIVKRKASVGINSLRYFRFASAAALFGAVMAVAAGGASAQCTPQWLSDPMSVPGLDAAPRAITEWDPDGPGPEQSRLVVAGSFSVAGGVNVPGIALWDGIQWSPLGSDYMGSVKSMCVLSTGELIVSPGPSGSEVSRWSGSAWVSMGPTGLPASSDQNERVRALVPVGNGRLAAGGVGGVSIWNGSAWGVLPDIDMGCCTYVDVSQPDVGDRVYAIAVLPNGNIIAGGLFRQNSNLQLSGTVAIWDGAHWQILPGLPGGSVQVAQSILPLADGSFIVGGVPYDGANIPANYVARWNGASWEPLSNGMTGGSGVIALAPAANGDVIAGGRFTSVGGIVANGIARWNGSVWTPLGSGMAFGWQGATVNSLYRRASGDVIVCGAFLFANGIPANYIARWGTPTSPKIDAQPAASIVSCGGNATFTTTVSGQGSPTYRWRRGGINLNDGATGHGSFMLGSTSPSLSVVNAGAADSGGYDCVVSSACGTASTAVAALTVQNCCRGDFNGSGSVEIQDIFDYLNAWFAQCP